MPELTRWPCPVCQINIIDLDNVLSYVERPGARCGDKDWLVCSPTCAANYGKPRRARRAAARPRTISGQNRRYEWVCWVRISMHTGDPLWKPHLHLTLDGIRTCCGRLIPQIGLETRDWRIEESESSLECAQCFTETRKEELRELEQCGVELLRY